MAGRLKPEKDSEPGIEALRFALAQGVRLVHSNPRLRTQWAVREAVMRAERPDGLKHLVKAELPPDVTLSDGRELVGRAIETSLAELDVPRLYGVVIEPDRKRGTLRDPSKFFERAGQIVWECGLADRVIGFCHMPTDVLGCLRTQAVCAVAALFNPVQVWPEECLPAIAATGRGFVGMAPLGRGGCLVPDAAEPAARLAALRWVLEQPLVAATTITMSSVDHVREVLEVACSVAPAPATNCASSSSTT